MHDSSDSAQTLVTSKTPAEIAAANRRSLAAEWLTTPQVDHGLRTEAGDSSQTADAQRRTGNLLAVWVAEHGYRFPPWQFHIAVGGALDLIAEMPAILTILREHGGVIDGVKGTSGWNEVEWFMTPHVDLDGATPVERLADHPDAVLRAAEAEFLEDADTGW